MSIRITYRKIPITSAGLYFFKRFFAGELIFGGAYYWKEFCVSKWVGLHNKNGLNHYENSLKQLTLTVFIWEGLLLEGFFASEIWGAYFREVSVIIRILRYVFLKKNKKPSRALQLGRL